MNIIQFLSDWLTNRADNVKARIPERVWKMFGFHVIKTLWNALPKLQMSSEQTCICLIHAVYTKCENSYVCEKEPTIYSHNSSTGFRNSTQQWVSWSSTVSVETQTRVTKGQKMGRAEAIQTRVMYFQRYHCLSLSVAGVDPGRGDWGDCPP